MRIIFGINIQFGGLILPLWSCEQQISCHHLENDIYKHICELFGRHVHCVQTSKYSI